MNSNFGDELTLAQCLEILRETQRSTVPDRAEFFLHYVPEILQAVEYEYSVTVIEAQEFVIEYQEQSTIFIHPLKEHIFAPCGWFDVQWLQKGEGALSDSSSRNGS